MLEKNVRLCLYVVLLNTLKCYVWKCIVCTELIHTMTNNAKVLNRKEIHNVGTPGES